MIKLLVLGVGTLAAAAAMATAGVRTATHEDGDRLPVEAGRIDWKLEPTDDKAPGKVQLQITWKARGSITSVGRDMDLAELHGMTAEQVASVTGAQTKFALDRDAGRFDCDGVVRRGKGVGDCTFAASTAFADDLDKRGMGRPSSRQMFDLAIEDIGYAYIDELNRQGYQRTNVDGLVSAGHHGVHLGYLKQMGDSGYRFRNLGDLVELRDHGVTPTYISELSAAGIKGLSAEALRDLRDHGVTPSYVIAMRDAGYRLDPNDYIRMRDHGVTPDYVAQLHRAGYRLEAEDLVRMRDHGVGSDYAADLKRLGYDLAPDEIVRLRDNGISVSFVERVSSGGKLSASELIRLRNEG